MLQGPGLQLLQATIHRALTRDDGGYEDGGYEDGGYEDGSCGSGSCGSGSCIDASGVAAPSAERAAQQRPDASADMQWHASSVDALLSSSAGGFGVRVQRMVPRM